MIDIAKHMSDIAQRIEEYIQDGKGSVEEIVFYLADEMIWKAGKKNLFLTKKKLQSYKNKEIIPSLEDEIILETGKKFLSLITEIVQLRENEEIKDNDNLTGEKEKRNQRRQKLKKAVGRNKEIRLYHEDLMVEPVSEQEVEYTKKTSICFREIQVFPSPEIPEVSGISEMLEDIFGRPVMLSGGSMDKSFKEFFQQLSTEKKADWFQEISREFSGTRVKKSKKKGSAYAAEFEQYPELCLFLAETLSEITEEAANQAINCHAEENNRKLTYRDISRYSLSQAREGSFLLFSELENNSPLFKKYCREVAAKQQAKKEEETYNLLRNQTLGWIRTLGFFSSMNPINLVASFMNACINEVCSISSTPKTLLQEVLSKSGNSSSKQEGKEMFRKKREVIEQLKQRIHWLSLSEFGKDKEVVANKKAMLKELKDRIKSVEAVTPSEILNVIKKWKQENNGSANAEATETFVESTSNTLKSVEALPKSITQIRKAFFSRAPEKSRSENLINSIQESLEKKCSANSLKPAG